MQLKCKINNVVYENTLVQGIPFSEEYSEVLDSASIIIDQVKQMNIKPYDDVYIYDANFDFEGFNENGLLVYNGHLIDKNGYLINENGQYINEFGIVLDENKKILKCGFYKHFLVNQFSEEMLFLNTNELIDNSNNGNLYKYKIELFSETKGLETIQLPNIAITQPLKLEKKVSTYKYLQQYIDMYSPKIKVAKNEKEWEYKNKYKLDNSLKEIFDDSYTPDFTLNSPNLRDILSKLMITKDMIPYVENNVIKALDITKRVKEFDLTKGEIGYIYGSLSSSNYAENLKTNYINALSQEKSCKIVEYLGFRNSDVSLMKIEDLRLETRFPIYKINKIYLCYYKKCSILTFDDTEVIETEPKSFLCKQDITKLVKLNSERNLLSKDFDEMENTSIPNTIEEMAQYKMCTVGYDIGSNYITGWGEKYSFLSVPGLSWFSETKSYIENIVNLVDSINPYGIYDLGYFNLKNNQAISMPSKVIPNDITAINPDSNASSLLTPFSNYALALKGFFFQVEYDGFYNGTVVTTKDGAESDITINDNQSNSLPLLEYDGLSQKEKINRFGNKGYTITIRYTDIKDLQPLGSYFSKDDVIIYHREYTINDKVINCTYYGMKDYVLKNYFTSVYAKHRPYNLMSYGESVSRAENKKLFLLLSKNKQLYEKENIFNLDQKFNEKIFSCFKGVNPNNIKSIKNFDFPEKINYAYFDLISLEKNGNKLEKVKRKYAADLNSFVFGNSLCFNSKMYDNVSSGVYIKKTEPFKGVVEYTYNWLIDPQNSYTGSLQSWYMTVDDNETGFLKNMGFYICHIDQSEKFGDVLQNFETLEKLEDESKKINEEYYPQLFKLPLIEENEDFTNIIGNDFEINKDNKEIIDITYQLEPITMDNNILFSPWMMKLSDLLSNYNKFSKNMSITTILPVGNYDYYFKLKTYPITITDYQSTTGRVIDLRFHMKFKTFEEILANSHNKNIPIDNLFLDYGSNYPNSLLNTHGMWIKDDNSAAGDNDFLISLNLTVKSIKSITENEIVLDVIQQWRTCKMNFIGEPSTFTDYNKRYDLKLFRLSYDDLPDYVAQDDIYDLNTICFGSFKELPKENGEGKTVTLLSNMKEYFELAAFNCDSTKKVENTIRIGQEITTFDYLKNMFILEDENVLKKELVYNEYDFDSNFKEKLSEINVSEIFVVEDSKIKIRTNLLNNNAKSLQFWYLDGLEVDEKTKTKYEINTDKASFKFVFGINFTQEDYKSDGTLKDEIVIYISTLSSMNKKVYDKNYNLIGENANYYTTEEVTGVIEIISIETEDRDDYIDIIITPNEILDYFKNNLYYSPEKDLICTFYIAPLSGSYEYGKNTRYKIEYEQENGIKFVSSNQELQNLEFKFIDNKLIATIDKYKIGGHVINRIIFNNGTTCRINFSSHPIYGEKQYYTKY